MDKHDTPQYKAPSVRFLGEVTAVTEAGSFNKIGKSKDQFTAITGGQVVGDIVPLP